jgi:hypothetical protein
MLFVMALTSGLWFLLRGGLSPFVRDRLVKTLKEHFESDVTLKNFQVSLFPHVRATGEELVLRHKGRNDVPPLITVKRFSAEAGIWGLFSMPKQIRMVRLEGLQVHVPPREHREERRDRKQTNTFPAFVIEEIDADGTFLQILPKEESKLPLEFDISKLTLHSAGKDVAMSFRATLTNPKPPGLIQSRGKFGPWQGDDPSLTPVSGNYTFQNADLSAFRGIAGTLSSEGKYDGVLEHIEVDGQTDTPDFLVKTSGLPVHLKTSFKATVDGTNGDTLLDPVNAQIIGSTLVAKGGVTGTRGIKGKTVSLFVTVNEGKLEDLLHLAVKAAQPPITGLVSFKTQFRLPPGDQDIVDKLNLDGAFKIRAAHFTSFKVQEKVETLSRRGKGQTEDTGSSNVVSNLNGAFTLKAGVITFSKLTFGVPGASVQLSGTYGLRDEKFDFHGNLRLEAKLSETTSGIKAFLLKAVDPLFKGKDAGSVIPIKVEGTRRQPSFGLDIAGALPGKHKEQTD